MSEFDWYAALGVAEGENEQEPAEPAADAVEDAAGQGEEVQEPAEPAEAAKETEEDLSTQSEPKGMTPEERHAAAEQRRAAQREELETKIREAMRKEHEKDVQELLAAMGIKDPENDGKPVTNMEDFRRWQQGQKSRQLRNELKEGRLSPEGLQQALLEAPEIKQMLDDARRTKFAADKELQLAEIRKEDPSIKSLDDIIQSERGGQFAEYVRRGFTYAEAYQMTYRDRAIQRARAAGEQAARNAAAGKAHLVPTKTEHKPPITVPENVRAMYRAMVPGITDEEITREFASTNLGRGGEF